MHGSALCSRVSLPRLRVPPKNPWKTQLKKHFLMQLAEVFVVVVWSSLFFLSSEIRLRATLLDSGHKLPAPAPTSWQGGSLSLHVAPTPTSCLTCDLYSRRASMDRAMM